MNTKPFIGLPRIGILIFAVATAMLLVGFYQAAMAFPHGCDKFDTGTSFGGYHCGAQTYYVPKQ